PRNNLRGDRRKLHSARTIAMPSRPSTHVKTFESQPAFLHRAVTHREAASSPVADLALDNDIVIETARHNEPRSNLYDWQTDHAVFLPHGGRRQSGALEQPSGTRIKDDEVLWIKHDPSRITLTTFNAQRPPVDQHWLVFLWLSPGSH